MFSSFLTDEAVNTDYQRRRMVIDVGKKLESEIYRHVFAIIGDLFHKVKLPSISSAGSAFSTKSVTPRLFRVIAITPENETEEATIPVYGEYSRLIPIVAKAMMKKVKIGNNPLLFWNEVTYELNEQEHVAVQCFEPKKKARVFMNFKGHLVLQKNNFIVQSRRIFPLDSRLPPVLRLPPLIVMLTDPAFYTVDENRELRETSLNITDDKSVVCMMMGMINSGRLLVELSTGSFVDIERIGLGSLLNDFFKDKGRKRVIVFLKDGDPVPRILLTKKEVALMFKRNDLSLEVMNERIHVRHLNKVSDSNLWYTNIGRSDFEIAFSTLARKSD